MIRMDIKIMIDLWSSLLVGVSYDHIAIRCASTQKSVFLQVTPWKCAAIEPHNHIYSTRVSTHPIMNIKHIVLARPQL